METSGILDWPDYIYLSVGAGDLLALSVSILRLWLPMMEDDLVSQTQASTRPAVLQR